MKKVLVLFCALLFVLSCTRNKNVVNVYNWTEYIPNDVITQFEQETGIKVIYSTYDSNELMYSKLKIGGGSGYDLVFPSTYFVSKMAKEGLLEKLDHSKLPNMRHLNPVLLNMSYDEGNLYDLPFLWGTTLIAYNEKFIKDNITSWKDLWNEDYKGYVILNNDVREVFQMALMLLGYSGNSSDEKEIEEAYELLTTLVPNVRVFNSDSPKLPLINEEVRVGMVWNGEIYRAQLANPSIKYIFPKEGPLIWMDCMSIPKGAKNIENAYKFMDFLLRPEISKILREDSGYLSPNLTDLNSMPDELKNNPLLNPTAEDLQGAEFQTDIGDAVLILEKYWEKLKTD
ncbi:MAG: spermidine/putrescine ABC transporter substrate-binding protein [Deferribacteraceae bacterium]|nr:spermidine/putrescine ABC transporter substrate-binding protein [Deferribacteraceae bacterium]